MDTTYFGGEQYYFTAEIISGAFATGSGEEYTDPDRNRGTYQPIWVELDELFDMDVRPREIAEKIADE